MRILIIGAMYEPDLGPAAPLFTMLTGRLVQRGHQVTIITMVPHYPTGRVPKEYRGRWVWRSSESGVDVIRVGLPSVDRAKLAQRLLQFICYQFKAFLMTIRERYDVVLAASPSLVVLLPFAWSVVARHKPAVYSVYDIYPDVGVKLGIFKHKALIDVVATMEKFCLNHAEIVRIVSESFRPGLLNMGVPEAKLHLIYDWVDTDLIQVLPRDNRFARDHHLTDRFVVMYAGNIGLSQGFECVITAARLLCDQKDIQFVFVGDGSGREDLISQVRLQNIANIAFIPFQPRERLPEVLASADVSLIVLRRGIGSDSLPSKTYSIMASGRPILASVDEECETRNFVIRADAGLCVSPEDPTSLAKAIMALKQDKNLRERLGSNGRNWAENHHSVQNAAEQFESLFESAISSSRS